MKHRKPNITPPKCKNCRWAVELPTVIGKLGCTNIKTPYTFHAKWNRYRFLRNVCGLSGKLFEPREDNSWEIWRTS